ncbi:MAG TPA: DUF559 domain-containing protein, partial [Beijerinckiaceae bacterium]|nr:DUF559 domain-containing protein [Beijerinckiaceae bacterium]
ARLVVEVDGATHSTDAEVERDRRRDVWLAAVGYETLRIHNDEIYHNRDGILETIRLRLAERRRASDTSPSQPSPSSKSGVPDLRNSHAYLGRAPRYVGEG